MYRNWKNENGNEDGEKVGSGDCVNGGAVVVVSSVVVCRRVLEEEDKYVEEREGQDNDIHLLSTF